MKLFPNYKMDSNKLEDIVSLVKTKGKLTKQYLIDLGKSFIRHEYEDLNINFVDKKYNKDYKNEK